MMFSSHICECVKNITWFFCDPIQSLCWAHIFSDRRKVLGFFNSVNLSLLSLGFSLLVLTLARQLNSGLGFHNVMASIGRGPWSPSGVLSGSIGPSSSEHIDHKANILLSWPQDPLRSPSSLSLALFQVLLGSIVQFGSCFMTLWGL